MANYTNFDLRNFIAESKKAKVVKENTQGFDALMDAVNDYIDPSHPDHERLAQAVENALDNAEIDTLEFSHSPSAPSHAVESIAKELGIEPQTSEESVPEVEVNELSSDAIEALTGLIGAGGLAGGAVALNKLMDALEAGKLGDKGKAIAKYLRDTAQGFKQARLREGEVEETELTKEEAFKKEIKDLLDS